jgi:hypothetical protein
MEKIIKWAVAYSVVLTLHLCGLVTYIVNDVKSGLGWFCIGFGMAVCICALLAINDNYRAIKAR